MDAVPARYPKNVVCDFRHLGRDSLIKLIDHYNKGYVKVQTYDLSETDLAIMVAKLFEMHQVSEVDTLDHFANKYCLSTMDSNNKSGGKYASNRNNIITSRHSQNTNFERLQLDSEIAKVGEQVAAKVSSKDEESAWILANVISYDPASNTYEVQDEDDNSKEDGNPTITLSAITHVKRLYDNAAYLHKGDEVLAVFPDTTSFYHGVVVRNPRPPGMATNSNESNHHSMANPAGWDVVIRFEDDEDDTGRSPPRKIPARFIMLVSDSLLPNNIPSTATTSTNGNGTSTRPSRKRNNQGVAYDDME
jgi:hypothetical protein